MEEKIIAFNGLSLSPSDNTSADGDASIAYNVNSNDGELTPFIMPDREYGLADSNERIQFAHNGNNYRHLITLNDGVLYWYDNKTADGIAHTIEGFNDTSVSKISGIGNTIIAFADDGMHYFLFKEGTYKYLGQKPPETPIIFGLDGDFECYENKEFECSTNDGDDSFRENVYKVLNGDEKYPSYESTYLNGLSDSILATTALFVNQQKKKGRFMMPFFIRYAYKLFDGTYTMQSAPILMIPNSSGCPFVLVRSSSTDNSQIWLKYVVGSPCMDLKIIKCYLNKILFNWSDIVKSIDIFISEQMYGYDPDGQISMVSNALYDESNFVHKSMSEGRISNGINFGASDYGRYYLYSAGIMSKTLAVFSLIGNPNLPLRPVFKIVNLPTRSGDNNSIDDTIMRTSLFYKIKSFSIDNENNFGIKDDMTIEFNVNDLIALPVKERLPDEYHSHDTIMPSTSFVYNKRLFIGDISRIPFKGFEIDTLKGYTLLYSPNFKASLSTTIYVCIRNGFGDDIIVSNDSTKYGNVNPYYFYYPNVNAYKAITKTIFDDGSVRYSTVKLKEHSLLNGAYWFDAFSDWDDATEEDIPEEIKSNSILEPNMMYTSSVGNPFHFPLTGVNTIGVGNIIAMSANTRPVSTGQFGQFPLFAFCSDGVYSLSISDEGNISAIKPYSREILSNPNVLPIDNAVVAITEKGVMVFSDQISNISEMMYGRTLDINNIMRLSEVAKKEGFDDVMNMVSFNTFMKDCVPAYDYPNQRIVFSNSQYGYSYLFSLRSATWTCIEDNFVASVSDYPNAYIQAEDGGIINIAQPVQYDSDSSRNFFFLSRPIKFGSLQYKQVSETIVRGVFNHNNIRCVLFASTDGRRYFPVGSCIGNRIARLCGTPFRFFRILVTGNLGVSESIDSTSFYVTPRWDNRPR